MNTMFGGIGALVHKGDTIRGDKLEGNVSYVGERHVVSDSMCSGIATHVDHYDLQGDAVGGNKYTSTQSTVDSHYGISEVKLGFHKYIPVEYLERALVCSRAVCKIKTPSGEATGFVTKKKQGYLCIMTSHHVISTKDDAARSTATFNFQSGKTSKTVKLQKFEKFITSKDLDFSIVTCNIPQGIEIEPISIRNSMSYSEDIHAVGSEINVIGHPGGELKQFVLHAEYAWKQDKLHHNADTLAGSSGSPIFNDMWELVAIHQGGNKDSHNFAIPMGKIVVYLESQNYDI